jgi:type II secretory pathway component PulF
MVAAILVVGALAMLCWFVPRLAWSIPGFSGLIAPWGRGRLLESLGLLVRSGRDLPSALELLDKPAIHGCEARRRLKLMRLKIDEGATANSAMRQAGWIDAPQEAWLGLATRSGRFSEALVELGGTLQSLSLRRLKWRSTLASTFGVLLVGLLVGLVVVAFFIPLVEMIEWLGG